MSLQYFTDFFQRMNILYPQLFWALLLFLIGYLIALFFQLTAFSFLNQIKLNQALQRLGWQEALSKIYSKFNGAELYAKIVKWFFVILFLMFSCEIIGFERGFSILEKVVGYYLNVFIACLISIIAIFLADFSEKIVVGTLEKEKITYSNFLSRLTKWTIWILSILAILYQLKIATSLVLVIFIGIVAAISIALGVSFGFGGKEIAGKILKELEDRFKKD